MLHTRIRNGDGAGDSSAVYSAGCAVACAAALGKLTIKKGTLMCAGTVETQDDGGSVQLPSNSDASIAKPSTKTPSTATPPTLSPTTATPTLSPSSQAGRAAFCTKATSVTESLVDQPEPPGSLSRKRTGGVRTGSGGEGAKRPRSSACSGDGRSARNLRN